MVEASENRVLILGSSAHEQPFPRATRERLPFDVVLLEDVDRLAQEMAHGVGVLVLVEEALSDSVVQRITELLTRQPNWSDLPVVVLTRPGADSIEHPDTWERLGNVTLLERPVRAGALISLLRAALRTRERQYEIRGYTGERDTADRVRALLAAIVESSDDAIVSKSLQGIIMSWNTGAERLFGYTAEEAIGRPITMIIPKERLEEEQRILAQISQGERLEHFETERVTKSGKRIPLSLTVSPIRNSLGQIIGASKVARDITARKQLEAEQEEANRRKDEFLATLAHELRNPLAPIRNALNVLANGSPGSFERVRAIMERQVDHMVRLVDDLLELSRITRGKIELRREPVDLGQVVRTAVETSRPLIDVAGHRLTIDLPSEPLALHADPVRISQILSNLLNNSAKYTPHGGEIRLTARREGLSVVITVSDNGIGIAPEALPRVFDMFMQGDSTNRQPEGGLGIGLTLVRSLVQMHGGSVEATSEGLGRGSEFHIRLPLVAEAPAAETGRAKPRLDAKLGSVRVLVADDNRDSADSLAMVLRSLGAEVEVVYDGDEALRALESRQTDIVLLDIGMPKLDGFETARRIRRNPAMSELTLIALTGWGQEEDRRRCYAAGFDYYLIKPVEIEKLQTLLSSIMRTAT
jgi:PAS domain S-box-containing protein